MTKKTFFLPDLGEGLPDAEIVEWLAKVGDTVMLDQPLVSMETAKAVVEVPSPFSGKLLRTGLTEEQALTTVTSNAAKLLRIDNRVGSLEPGKDADFVVWNGDPLSQFTKAEQTWVDGRRYFSLEEDAARRVEVDKERRQLIQAVLSASGSQTRAATSGRN